MKETSYRVEILKKMSLELQIENPEVEPNGKNIKLLPILKVMILK